MVRAQWWLYPISFNHVGSPLAIFFRRNCFNALPNMLPRLSKSVGWISMERNSVRHPMCGASAEGMGGGFLSRATLSHPWKQSCCKTKFGSRCQQTDCHETRAMQQRPCKQPSPTQVDLLGSVRIQCWIDLLKACSQGQTKFRRPLTGTWLVSMEAVSNSQSCRDLLLDSHHQVPLDAFQTA